MYANSLKGRDNHDLIVSIFNKEYEPAEMTEEFKDKVGILGIDVFYNMFQKFPNGYDYDDSFGVQVNFDQDGKSKFVRITTPELKQLKPDKSLPLFHTLETTFRERFKAENIH
jgi:hypothetical protein